MSDDPRDSNPEPLPGQRLAEHLLAQAREHEPKVDFARIEAGLARDRLAQGRRQKLGFAWVLQLAAAAAAAVLWFGHRFGAPSESTPVPAARVVDAPPVARVAQPEAAALTAGLSALAGGGTLQHVSGVEEPLRIASELREGDCVRLANDAVAHLRVDRGSGVVLGPGTELVLRRLRRGEIELELARGRVTSQVAQLTAAERWLVHAAGHSVAVRGTHFEVTASADALGVTVAEGHVAVLDEAGAVIAELRARDQFAFDQRFGMRLATRDPQQPPPALDQPRALGGELTGWPLVTLLDLNALESLGVTGFVLDGSRFPANGELAARVPPGDVSLTVERLTLAPQKIVLHVPAAGLSLAPEALRKLLRQSKTPGGAAGRPEIDFQPVLAVVRSGSASLSRCYERALKQRSDLDGSLMLRLTIDPKGRVKSAEPRGQAAQWPSELVTCLRNTALQWQFPASGAGLAFDVPLRLQPR